jgi:hypothetical protein
MKRRPAYWSGASKAAVRAPSSRYASTNYACVRSTSTRIEASALSTWLHRLLNLASSSSARWQARPALRLCKFGVDLRSLRISNGLVRLPPLLHQLAPEIPLLGLHSGQPLCQPVVFTFCSRLLLNSICMHGDARLWQQTPQSEHPTRHGRRSRPPTTKNHETRNLIKTTNYRSPTRLTCFSYYDSCY